MQHGQNTAESQEYLLKNATARFTSQLLFAADNFDLTMQTNSRDILLQAAFYSRG
jgi:hypothetical protein